MIRVNGPADRLQPTLCGQDQPGTAGQLVSDSGDGRADIGGVNFQLAAGRQLWATAATSSSDNRRHSNASSGM
jgi:hypothetical protein